MWLFFKLGQGFAKKCPAPQAITPGRQVAQRTGVDAAVQAGMAGLLVQPEAAFSKTM